MCKSSINDVELLIWFLNSTVSRVLIHFECFQLPMKWSNNAWKLSIDKIALPFFICLLDSLSFSRIETTTTAAAAAVVTSDANAKTYANFKISVNKWKTWCDNDA